MDPRNGEILALVSRPSFDPNAFAVKIDRAEWNKLVTDPDHPLMNKAIQAQLAPGSTFKILMSVAGLQEGIAQNLNVDCAGGWGPYGFFHHCDENHGAVDIHNAIPFSCDTYYYHARRHARDRPHCEVCDRVWLWAEDGDRPAGRAGRVDAERALADEELSPQVVSRRDARRFHRTGRGGGDADCNWRASSAASLRADTWCGPTWCFPTSFRQIFVAICYENLPGSGDVNIPIDPENWTTITDGMAEVTQPGYFPHGGLGAP